MPFDPQAGEADQNKKILAVHAALLPTGDLGQILYFSGNKWDTTNHDTGQVDHSLVFDYATHAVSNPHSPTGAGGYFDMFCSGHALLPDGRVLVAGGTSTMGINDPSNPHDGHWGGLREGWIFDPLASTNKWQAISPMNPWQVQMGVPIGGGRWYTTLLTLASGDIMAMCGHPFVHDPEEASDDPRHNNNTPEVFHLSAGFWNKLNELGEGDFHDFAVFYPRLHVLPSGRVLIVQPLYSNMPGSVDPTHQFAFKTLVYDPAGMTVVNSFPGPQLTDGQTDYLNPGYAAQPTTSVLLPLLPDENYHARVLLCGGVKALIANLQPGSEASWSWQATSDRQLTVRRSHCNAVLLPDGKVFVCGGINQFQNNPPTGQTYDQAFGVTTPEIYDPTTGTWAALDAAPAMVARGYHSVALLMVDGRVWTAGSEVNNVFGANNAEYRIELFEPDYIEETDRAQITDGPPSVAYGETFRIAYQLAPMTSSPNIVRVAIIRFGSATHGFDSDQRYVGLEFEQDGPNHLRVTAPPDSNIAPPGYYMLWLLDDGGRPSQRAAVLRVGFQSLYAVMDRDTFSIYEVQAVQQTGTSTFERAFYAVFDGFIPNEVIGSTFNVTFSHSGLNASLSVSGGPNPALELSGSPQLIQRTTFAFDLHFNGTDAFAGLTGTDNLRIVDVTISTPRYSCSARIDLITSPNPYMIDGQPPWLSTDVRVFQLTPNQVNQYLPPGASWTSPNQFITQLIQHCNSIPVDNNHPFQTLPINQEMSILSLAPTNNGAADGTPVYNFALAKVRYLTNTNDPSANARYVRVLFRAFRTAQAELAYDTSTIYRRVEHNIEDGGMAVTTDAIPLLGISSGQIISIPFFAAPRVAPNQDMVNQSDDPNLLTLPARANTESYRFFGCWLDVNQPGSKRFPRYPGDETSFAGVNPADLLSIQELMLGHQCLVAEVHYKLDLMSPDLIQHGDTPFSSDKLSQRNLMFSPSSNPGSPATRTVQHTFNIHIISGGQRSARDGETAQATTTGQSGFSSDGLIFWWGNLPRETMATLYTPGLEVLSFIPPGSQGRAQTFEIVNEHTLRLPVGDNTFIPLPFRMGQDLPALLTLELPAGVRRGQVFDVVVQQYSGVRRRITGAFQLRIPVKSDYEIIGQEKDKLAIMRYILEKTPESDQWHLILQEMVRQTTLKVKECGGDPERIKASPYGAGPYRRGCCALIASWLALLQKLIRKVVALHNYSGGAA
jgi:hypothetical protein